MKLDIGQIIKNIEKNEGNITIDLIDTIIEILRLRKILASASIPLEALYLSKSHLMHSDSLISSIEDAIFKMRDYFELRPDEIEKK